MLYEVITNNQFDEYYTGLIDDVRVYDKIFSKVFFPAPLGPTMPMISP